MNFINLWFPTKKICDHDDVQFHVYVHRICTHIPSLQALYIYFNYFYIKISP